MGPRALAACTEKGKLTEMKPLLARQQRALARRAFSNTWPGTMGETAPPTVGPPNIKYFLSWPTNLSGNANNPNQTKLNQIKRLPCLIDDNTPGWPRKTWETKDNLGTTCSFSGGSV